MNNIIEVGGFVVGFKLVTKVAAQVRSFRDAQKVGDLSFLFCFVECLGRAKFFIFQDLYSFHLPYRNH